MYDNFKKHHWDE
jgi:hypothetical protein